MKPHIGYTYLIKFKPTGQFYYGSRCAKGCHPDEFWISYFTSSKLVHEMIEKYGKNSFEFEIRATFPNCPRDAQDWERKVLRRMSVCGRQDFLNKHNGCVPVLSGWKNPFFGKKHSEETRQKMRKQKRKSSARKKISNELREKLSLARKGKSYVHLYGEEKSNVIKRKLSRCGIDNPMFGRSRPEIAGDLNPSKSDDVKEKLRSSKLERDLEKILCNVCERSFDVANFTKSHGEKCWRSERSCLACTLPFKPKWKKHQTCSRLCGYRTSSAKRTKKIL